MKLTIAVALALFALGAVCLSPALAATVSPRAASYNWSGYAASGHEFSSVRGSWTVPDAALLREGASDAHWVGIGGLAGNDLIQVGTRARRDGDLVSYMAWYETLPATATPIPMKVHPGDVMRASLALVAKDTWALELRDITTGEDFSIVLPYRSSQDSAEWIEEVPSGTGAHDISPPALFSEVYATVRGGTPQSPEALGATRLYVVAAQEN